MDSETDDSGSDYVVENYVRPNKITKVPVNDDSADLLGNFDDAKRKQLADPSFYDDQEQNSDLDEHVRDDIRDDHMYGQTNVDDKDNDAESNSAESDSEHLEINTKLSKEQIEELRRGASKTNRFVLYVTNLNFESTKEDLENFFSSAGKVKGVRIPRQRSGGFAFVEMENFDGFQKAFEFHNTELHGRTIKIQISEGGKKKSANKKNILKQKNRKLAEMRNERKHFTKSGKNYDKKIKKEKDKEMLMKKRWRKPAIQT